jgi:REP element-mobilizing transposase RayT
MSRPPRLERICERNKEVTYFITWCVEEREPVLDNIKYYEALKAAIHQADRWEVECGMIMPDHVHLMAAPFHRDESVGNFVGFLKKRSKYLSCGKWHWQPGLFDHLLRSNESAGQKWKYIRENPVRAGLVADWKEWPYWLGFDEARE